MKSENESKATGVETPPIGTPSRDDVRACIKASATLLGCDEKSAVSGSELLMLFSLALRKFGCMEDKPNPIVRALCGHFDSNSSAMTKRLYENGDAPSKADKYSGMI